MARDDIRHLARERLQIDLAPLLRPNQRHALVANSIRRMREKPRAQPSLFGFEFFDRLPNVEQLIGWVPITDILNFAHNPYSKIGPP
jgi:hypothetical protein